MATDLRHPSPLPPRAPRRPFPARGRRGAGWRAVAHLARALCAAWLLCFCLCLGTAPALAQAISPEKIVSETDRAIALVHQGKLDEAYRVLVPVNDATYTSNDYSIPVTHYPNLGFAIYHARKKDWQETIRYASSVTSALDLAKYRNHPTRLRANFHYGRALFALKRYREAEAVFESLLSSPDLARTLPDTHFVTLYWASRTASAVSADNPIALYSRFLELADSRPLAPLNANDVFRIKYAFVKHMGRKNLMTVDERLAYVQLMVDDIANEPDVSEYATRFYTAYEGYLLRVAGNPKAALPKQRQFHDYLTQSKRFKADYDSNAYRMMRTVLAVEGNQATYAFIEEVAANLEKAGAKPIRLAVYHKNLAALASREKNWQLNQKHLRTAYVYARQQRRANDRFTLGLAEKIDRNDPGFADFPFAHEIGRDLEQDIHLTADASTAFALVYQGNYLAGQAFFDKAKDIKADDPALYHLNRAAFDAVLNRYDDAEEHLALARRALRQTLGSEVSASTLVPDLIEVYNRVYISSAKFERAASALQRLRARQAALDPQKLQFFLALEAQYYELKEQAYDRDRALEQWTEVARQSGVTDIYGSIAHLIAYGILEGAFGVEAAAQAHDRQTAYLRKTPSMALMRDLIELLENSYTVAFGNSGEGLARLGQLQQAVSVQLPKGHPSISMVRYQLAEAHLGASQFKEALRWYGRTLEALHDNPYGKSDIVSFIISRQALALWQLGRTDEATVMAKSAYDLIKADRSAQNATFSQVLDLYVALLAYENKNWEEAANLLRTYINDPSFFGELNGNSQFFLVKRLAVFVAEYGTLEETLAALQEAENLLQSRFSGDRRFDLSTLLVDRARVLYWDNTQPARRKELLARAYQDITQASDVFFEWRDDISRRSGADASQVSTQSATTVVGFQAAIGWDYAQTLRKD